MHKLKKSIPNLFTITSLFLGFSAILASLQSVKELLPTTIDPDPEKYLGLAGIFIVAGCFLDLFDGLLARMLGAESAFGKQLDSLADLITFGLAPGVLFYTVTLFAGQKIGGAIPYQIAGIIPDFLYTNLFMVKVLAFLFPIAAGVRLARFNESAPSMYFAGIPSTYAGGMMALIFTFNFFLTPFSRTLSYFGVSTPHAVDGLINFTDRLSHNFLFLLLTYIILGVLMIVNIKFIKIKYYARPGGFFRNKYIFAFCIVLLILFFKYFLIGIGTIYFSHNIFACIRGRCVGEGYTPSKKKPAAKKPVKKKTVKKKKVVKKTKKRR